MASTDTVTQRPCDTRAATLLAAKSIWLISQPPKMSPLALESAGMAICRIIGMPSGGHSFIGSDILEALFDPGFQGRFRCGAYLRCRRFAVLEQDQGRD